MPCPARPIPLAPMAILLFFLIFPCAPGSTSGEAAQQYQFELVFPFSAACTGYRCSHDSGVPEIRKQSHHILTHMVTFAHSTYEGDDDGARKVASSLIGNVFRWPVEAYHCAFVKKAGEERTAETEKRKAGCRFDPPESIKIPVGVIIHSGPRRFCVGAVDPLQCG